MTKSLLCTTRIAGTPLRYLVKWSARSRRMRLAVSEEGVTVTLPLGIAGAEAEKFIQQNAAWLHAQMQKVERSKVKHRANTLPKDVILLRGKPTQVRVTEEEARKSRALVRESAGRLEVLLPAGDGAKKGKVVESALRQMARGELEQAVKQQSRVMNLAPRQVTVRDQRTRWGSCSTRGTLSFNWRLVMAPPEILNYVVVHELAHLKVPNHSAAFWNLVSRYYPAYKEARLWLKRNAGLLRPEL